MADDVARVEGGDPWTSVPATTSGTELVVGISRSGEELPSGEGPPELSDAPSDLRGR